MRNTFIVFLLGLLIFSMGTAFGEVRTADMLVNDALNDIKVAQEFMLQANQVLEQGQNRQTVDIALSLYIKAGRLFEEAHNTFKRLGTDYVKREDIEGAYQAMQNCLKAVRELEEVRKRM